MPGIIDLFVPKEKKFFVMLKDLSARTLTGAKLFSKFVKEYSLQSQQEKTIAIEELKKIEHECDLITHTIVIELNRAFLTPIDREDLHELSTLLDDIMDIIYMVCSRMAVYNMKKMPKYVLQLALAAYECVEQIDIMIAKLGLKTKISNQIAKVHELEKKADFLLTEAFANLFNSNIATVEIIKLKDTYEMLESICDKSEDIADVVENIVIKYA